MTYRISPLILLLLINLPLFGQVELAQEVANDLFYASGQINQQRPTVTIASGLALPTQSNPEEKLIQIDQKALAICEDDKKSKHKNALAALLAAEIVTLYNQEASPEKAIKDRVVYAYMAGYQTLGPEANDLWNKIHQAFPKLETQLPLADRKAKMDTAKIELEKFIPFFEMANYFMIVGKPELAGVYYDKVKEQFPSREVYSNAGVAKAMEALDLFGISELKYTYPFVLDLGFRAGQKGEKEQRESLLKLAVENFQEAIRRDSSYALGFVNLSCAQSLLKDYSSAIANAKEGLKFAEQQKLPRVKGSALIALGISYAESGDQTSADEAFANASDIEDETIQNLVKVNRSETLESRTENSSFKDEKIDSESLQDLANKMVVMGDWMPEPYNTIPLLDSITLFEKNEQNYRLLVQYEEVSELIQKFWFFQVTKPGYEGKTLREIAHNSFIDDITDEEAYGMPKVIQRFGKGKLLYYEKSGLIFQLNEDDEVVRWVLVYDS